MATKDVLRQLGRDWEERRLPFPPEQAFDAAAPRPRRTAFLITAAAAAIAMVIGAVVIVRAPEGLPDLSTQMAPAPDEQPPLVGPPTWGPPAQLIPFEGDLLVVSEPPWDSTVIPDGPGGLSRVDLDTGEVTILTEIPALSRVDLDGTGHLWVTAGPNRVLRIDPATGNVLGETLLPEVTPIVPPTVLPGSSTAETGPIVVEASPTGTDAWILRSSGITTDVFHLTADDTSTPAPMITLGGNAHAAELTADGGLWIALGTGGLTRLDTQTLDTDEIQIGADGGTSPRVDVVVDLISSGEVVWVAGTNGSASVVAVPIDAGRRVRLEDPATGEAVGSVSVTDPARLVAGDSEPLVLADGEVRELLGGRTVAPVPPGARAAVFTDGALWSAGAFWVAAEDGEKLGLPGRTVAAPSVQAPGEREPGIFGSDPPPASFDRVRGRLRWEIVDPLGSRIEVSLPDSVPWQGDPAIGVFLDSIGTHEGQAYAQTGNEVRRIRDRTSTPAPCDIDTCPLRTALIERVPGGWVEVDRSARPTAVPEGPSMSGVEEPVESRFGAEATIDGWKIAFEVSEWADAVAIARQLEVTTTTDGFPLIGDPSALDGVESRLTTTFQPVRDVAGIEITIRKGCRRVQTMFSDVSTCLGGYRVAISGPDPLATDILGTIQVRQVD